MHDYFYGREAEQFSFYRIPTVLFTDEQYKAISPEAKTLYGILLKRMDLSVKNEWFDEQGRVYIIFPLEEIMERLGCADKKATRLMDELEQKAGLIERLRQGQGKPNLIYVKNFIDSVENSPPESSEQRPSKRDVKCWKDELKEIYTHMKYAVHKQILVDFFRGGVK